LLLAITVEKKKI